MTLYVALYVYMYVCFISQTVGRYLTKGQTHTAGYGENLIVVFGFGGAGAVTGGVNDGVVLGHRSRDDDECRESDERDEDAAERHNERVTRCRWLGKKWC